MSFGAVLKGISSDSARYVRGLSLKGQTQRQERADRNGGDEGCSSGTTSWNEGSTLAVTVVGLDCPFNQQGPWDFRCGFRWAKSVGTLPSLGGFTWNKELVGYYFQ
ncbi:hypothetical protein DL546_008536 [Coniochaeta pulveracea]|uniref:Uncharacterized protein n=1 Tax=Coniochaeta pulveracea TaxID=177199 RepID=A0A420YDD7_9PEZI|nr:hypothetical protein DL546_008536 [Coniochaeta pulveracea]